MTFTIDRTIPVAEQLWRKHLILVSSLPSRFLGLVSKDELERAMDGKPFQLEKVAVYFCNFSIQPAPNGRGVSMATVPHTLLAYDLIDTLKTVEIIRAEHIIRVNLQSEKFSTWMFDQYLGMFDPPKLSIIGGR